MTSSFEVVTTRRGELAVIDCASGEIMHPVGPLDEAEELYTAPSRLAVRLLEDSASPLVLYDVGLGAGTNAASAWRVSEARNEGRNLSIISFDRTTAALELALEPRHSDAFGLDEDVAKAARTVITGAQGQGIRTAWSVVIDELPYSLAAGPKADVVFWDPFSPKVNPALWTVRSFSFLRRQCNAGATIHTYSASTRVRSAMLLAGFVVGLGTSTGIKEHTTIAATSLDDLETPLGARWLSRLGRSTAPLPDDAPKDALSRIRALPQFAELD